MTMAKGDYGEARTNRVDRASLVWVICLESCSSHHDPGYRRPDRHVLMGLRGPVPYYVVTIMRGVLTYYHAYYGSSFSPCLEFPG